MEVKDNLDLDHLIREMNNFVHLLPENPNWALYATDSIQFEIKAKIEELLETEFKDINSAALSKLWSDAHDEWIKTANNRRKSPRTKQNALKIVQGVEFEVLSTLYPLFKKMLALGYDKRKLQR
jgi:hypothetical protein